MDIDGAYREIGELGYYQKRLLFFLIIQQIWAAHHMLHMVFMGASPDHHICHHGNNTSRDYCSTPMDNITCDRYSYPETSYTSIVTEWQLICEKSSYANLVQSAFMSGGVLGAGICGSLSDRLGRRKVLTVCLVGLGMSSFLGSIAWSYLVYLVMRTFAGMFCMGIWVSGFVLGTEFVGSSQRALVCTLFQCRMIIGMSCFSLLAYLIRSWRVLSVVISLPGFIFAALTICLVPESPRWLLTHDRKPKAEAILQKMAMKNNSKLRTVCLNEPKKQKHTSHGIFSLLLHAELRKRTLILMTAYFVSGLLYFGLSVALSTGSLLQTSIYISTVLSVMAEIPGPLISLPIASQLGRKGAFGGTMVLSGVSCILIMATPTHSIYVAILALLGKLCISAAKNILQLYTAELYPTVVRNLGVGVCFMAARCGSVFPPVITMLDNWYPDSHFAAFGILAIATGVIISRLPETTGQSIPETIEDLNQQTGSKLDSMSSEQVSLLEEGSAGPKSTRKPEIIAPGHSQIPLEEDRTEESTASSSYTTD